MPLYTARPVANGLRTDHPIPDLPFVDDEHIPLDDPVAIEAIGRHRADDMHGREDRCKDGGWLVMTTDPQRHDLAWVVRWHPTYGRSVTVYRDSDAWNLHGAMMYDATTALLFRVGGYWWDGVTWYRPGQVWDGAAEHFYQRPVPAVVTVTAADLLSGGDADRATVLSITDLGVDAILGATPTGTWRNDLALWAAHRPGGSAGGPQGIVGADGTVDGERLRGLEEAVVTLAAPELTGDQLVGVSEMAEIGGISASTLRAYISRGEGDVPLPQSTISGRSVWSRPVAEEWAEHRRRSAEGLDEALGTAWEDVSLPAGKAAVWARFSRSFFSRLWGPGWRKRWALRWRTETAVKEIADTLSWEVVASLGKVIPVGDLSDTIQRAVLHELAFSQQLERSVRRSEELDEFLTEQFGDVPEDEWQTYAIGSPVARMLDWLIRHEPVIAGRAIEQIIGEAGRALNIPRPIAERSIAQAIALDSTLDEPARREFLTRVLSPNYSA